MYSIIFDEGAFHDIERHAGYYENQIAGLGKKFIAETYELIDLIKLNPKLFVKRRHGSHTAVYKKFPYLLYYFINQNTIIVLSVMPSAMALKKHRKTISSRKKKY